MPIYEYACTSCGKVFEAFILRSADASDVACPVCQTREVSRQLSRPAAARVGSGGSGAPPPPCGPVG